MTGRRQTPDFVPSKLTQAREARSLSIADVARHLDVSRQTVFYWETGTTSPRREMVVKLCKMFGVTPGFWQEEK